VTDAGVMTIVIELTTRSSLSFLSFYLFAF